MRTHTHLHKILPDLCQSLYRVTVVVVHLVRESAQLVAVTVAL